MIAALLAVAALSGDPPAWMLEPLCGTPAARQRRACLNWPPPPPPPGSAVLLCDPNGDAKCIVWIERPKSKPLTACDLERAAISAQIEDQILIGRFAAEIGQNVKAAATASALALFRAAWAVNAVCP